MNCTRCDVIRSTEIVADGFICGTEDDCMLVHERNPLLYEAIVRVMALIFIASGALNLYHAVKSGTPCTKKRSGNTDKYYLQLVMLLIAGTTVPWSCQQNKIEKNHTEKFEEEFSSC